MSDSTLIHNYTEEHLHSWFDAQTFAKATPYVETIDKIETGGRAISAWVQGSQRVPYRVRVEFFPVGPRSGTAIYSSCTCPVGLGCKHAAALLRAALARRTTGTPNLVRPEIESWLATLARLTGGGNNAGQDAKTRAGAKKSGPALFYLLTPVAPGPHWEVRWRKASRAADGGMAGEGQAWTNFEAALTKPPAFLSEADEEILHLLWPHRPKSFDRYWSTGLPLAGRNFARVLPRILDSGRAYFAGENARVALKAGASRPARLEWRPQGAGVAPRLGGEPAFSHVIAGRPPWYLDADGGEAGPIDCELDAGLLDHLLALPTLGQAEARLVASTLEKVAPALPRPIDLGEMPTINAPPKGILDLEHGLEDDERYEFVTYLAAAFRYGPATLALDHTGEFVEVDGATTRIRRDAERERALLAALDEVGLQRYSRQGLEVKSRLPGRHVYGFEEVSDWLVFADRTRPLLEAAGWEVNLPAVFRYRIRQPDAWYAELEESGNDFALEMGVEIDGQRLSLAPMIHVMLRHEARWFDAKLRAAIPDDELVHFRLRDGSRAGLPAGRLRPLVEVLVDLLDHPGSDPLRLSRLDTARLAEATQDADWRLRGMDTALALHQKLKASTGVAAVAPPEGFGATLRPYQLTGLAWLQFLREHGLGGILADDMGLGKTAQTLAHLLAEKQAGRLGPQAADGPRPALVVLPTSLVHNWRREAGQFAPQLSVLSLHGNDRKDRFGAIAEHDLVLTTYPLLWRDAATLKTHTWHTLILDEAQTVKNAASRAAETVRQLKADHRLCLTGTPLENHLGELWAQFDFLLPGLLGDVKSFSRDWRNPIEKRGDTLRRDLLARRLRPFILRRKKDEVAKELPPKNVIVRTVELEGAQRDLYETVRSTMDKKVRDEIAKKGFARSQIVILDALLKLRQTCCDPRLLKSEAARKVKERAKLDLLMAMLPELVDEGRRILVFSQFAEMLDLIEAALAAAGLAYVRLSGQTKDRETPIRRFQAGEVPIFLISLKAGGVGLNLTAADTVIHYDPWWNPAAENQATDRAHRIGQTKQVFVYKLIVAGSIEEKILGLQDKKAALAEGILSEKGDALAKFSPDDLSALLEPLG